MSAARIAARRRSARGAGAVRLRRRHLGGQQIAALGHGLEQLLRLVAQGLADVADALGDRFVGHHHVRPDRGHDRVAVHDPAGVLDQQPQQRQRLRPQRHLGAVRAEQRAAGEVEGEAVEAPGPGRRAFGVHRRFLPARGGNPEYPPDLTRLSAEFHPAFTRLSGRGGAIGVSCARRQGPPRTPAETSDADESTRPSAPWPRALRYRE